MLVIFLILISTRPFISSRTFPEINLLHFFLLLVFLALWTVLRGIRFKELSAVRMPLVLFILSLGIGLVFSQNQLVSIRQAAQYLGQILVLAFAFSLSRRDQEKIILCMIACGLFVSLLAIYQFVFGFNHLLAYVSRNNITDPFILESIQRRRVFFPFITPGALGGYLAMILALTLDRKSRIFIIPSLLLALLLTQSLSALLSLFMGILVYFYLEGRLEKKKIVFIGGLWLLMAGVLLVRLAASKEHLHPVFSAAMRLSYWKDALSIIRRFPVTGVGLGNFNLVYARYAHNSYLQIWAEMGILGLVSFLWIILRIFQSAFLNLSGPQDRRRTACLAAASLVFLTHNLMDFTFFLPEVAMLWWVISGLMLSKK